MLSFGVKLEVFQIDTEGRGRLGDAELPYKRACKVLVVTHALANKLILAVTIGYMGGNINICGVMDVD
jgi:hypothetical protein